MKHCLIITAYKNINQINQLITITPNDWGIYIHIDKKSMINESDINKRAHVFKQKKIYWGSWEHLYVIVFLLKEALKSNIVYDFYHIITGQDFYATSPYNFDKFLKKGNNYIECFDLPKNNWWGNGIDIIYFKTISSYGDIRFGLYKLINRILRHYYNRSNNKEMAEKTKYLYGGSVYCSLSYDFVKWITESYISNKLLNDLKNTLCSEEIYFQTLINNSPFRNTIINNNYRYIDWSAKIPPKILELEDFPKFKDKYLFCRKIELSSELYNVLISQI